jgi:murein L,D-transpeptidase YafK
MSDNLVPLKTTQKGRFLRALADNGILKRQASALVLASFMAASCVPALAQESPGDFARQEYERTHSQKSSSRAQKTAPASKQKGLFDFLFKSSTAPTQPDFTKSSGRLKTDRQIAEMVAEKGFSLGAPMYIRILKKEKQLEVWMQKTAGARYEKFKSYDIRYLHNDKLGPKIKQGDHTTPEGVYPILPQNVTTGTAYHMAIDFGYPNQFDRSHGRSGSLVRIHGIADGSAGCPVMTDGDIEEIYTIANAALKAGHTNGAIYVFPFEMSTSNMLAHAGHPSMKWWKNELLPIAMALEKHMPLNISMDKKRYTVLEGNAPSTAVVMHTGAIRANEDLRPRLVKTFDVNAKTGVVSERFPQKSEEIATVDPDSPMGRILLGFSDLKQMPGAVMPVPAAFRQNFR